MTKEELTAKVAATRHPAVKSDTNVNGGALKLALNVLRRAGKTEVADELEITAQPATWPKDAAEVREFMASNCERTEYANAPAAQALYSVRIFWQQHTQAYALSMTMAELHDDVELVIRTAQSSAAPQPAAQAGEYESLAQTWELNAIESVESSTGASMDYNEGIAAGMHQCASDLRAARGQTLRLLTQEDMDSLGRRAEGMDGNEWDKWVQEKFAQVNGLKVQGGSYEWDRE